MIVEILIFLTSVAALCGTFLVPGQLDLVLVAGPCAVVGLFLLVRAFRRRGRGVGRTAKGLGSDRTPRRGLFQRLFRRPPPRWIVVDGSNVMHWKDNTPRIDTLQEVLGRLKSLGFMPGVVFDANAGYLLAGSYKHDHALGRLLDLPESRVMVVAKGTPADPFVLAAARELGARIVTNDRYRDWANDHPEVAEAGHLIRGGYREGALWLDLG